MASGLNILVTGAAGFIGWKVCEFLLTKPEIIPDSVITQSRNNLVTINVIGIDNLNDYYDVRLKHWRLDQLKKYKNFHFHKIDIENYDSLKKLFEQYSKSPVRPDSDTPFLAVVNLAARAGVRYSMKNPFIYFRTNVIGNLNLLELCREFGVKKYIMASTSSLYAGQKMPFSEALPVNEPISPYAASKKGGEATCFTYHKLYGIDITILRYFTVYGPAGRPDMSIFRFISWIDQGQTVTIFGDGSQSRDFTFVEDIARGTLCALKLLGFQTINLGGDAPHKLIDVLHMIEDRLDKKAQIKHEPFHPADIMATWADITKAKRILGWIPSVTLSHGVEVAVDWYLRNYSLASKVKL